MKKSLRLAALLVVAVVAFAQAPSVMLPGFAIKPAYPRVGDLVRFTDYSVGAVVSWQWDFGDGGSSELRNPTHVYNEAGAFEVSLTIADAEGNTVTLTR